MEWVSGNIFIRPNKLPQKGNAVDGHEHHFDHTTIVFTGSFHVRKWKPICNDDGSFKLDEKGEKQWYLVLERDFRAPAHFLVEAGAKHEITAIEDGSEFWCVYSHRTPQGDIVQEWDGWYEATN